MKKELLEKIIRERMKPTIPSSFNINEICFKEQKDFILDPAPWVTACCSRRAGKSVACAVDLLLTAASTPGIVCLYITLTRSTAEKIVWPTLLELNRAHNFNCKINISKLSLTLPNGSVIYLSGCNNKAEVEKFRGLALKLVYIDEAQSFRMFIKELIDEVLAPALMDYGGSLKLIGTPAAIKAGYFFETTQSDVYKHHKWSFWENDFIRIKSNSTHQELMDRELRRRGVTLDDPSIRREWFGEWQDDLEALVCKYDKHRNHYTSLPPVMDYVIGIDIGFSDSDAISVLGWSKTEKKVYLVEEFIKPKQGITELMEEISRLYIKYEPLKMVMDEGGLGKKIGEELRKRYSLPIYAAEKSRKLEFIELMNDAFRTSSFFAKNTSRFAQDSLIIEWDYDKSSPDKKVIKKLPHSDIFDSTLYAFRECLHWLSEAPAKKLNPVTDWAQIMEKQMYEAMEKQQQQILEQDMANDLDAIMEMTGFEFQDYELNAAKYYAHKQRNK